MANSEVSRLKFNNTTYDIADELARQNIGVARSEIATEAARLDAVDTGLAGRITNLENSAGAVLVAKTKSDMSDTSKIYVYTGSESGMTRGNWYYHNGSAWVSGGAYNQNLDAIDATLTQSNKGADAKVTGDRLTAAETELNNLKNELNYNSAEMDTTDYVKSLGVVSGRLKDDGTVDATQTGWITTDYIPVESDKTYVYQTPNFEGNYTLIRCTYDSSKTLISRANLTYTAPEQIYPITGATKYVRFSVSVATYNAGIYFRAYHSRIDTLESYSDGIRNTYELTEGLRGETDYIKLHRLFSGKLQSNGEVWALSEHLTTDYIPVSPGVVYVLKRAIASDFTVWLGTYDAGKNPVDYVSGELTISGSYYFRPPDGVAYVRLCFSVNAYNSGLEFKAVNNWYDITTENIRNIETEIYDFVEKGIVSAPEGYKLNISSGLSEKDSAYQLVKYGVTAGEFLKVVADDCFQFQDDSSVPTTGTNHRVGSPYQAGEYYLTVPENATYLIVSTPIENSKAIVAPILGATEKAKGWITADEELLGMTDYIKIFGWEVGKLANGVVDASLYQYVTIADYIPLKYGELLSFYNNGTRTIWVDIYNENKVAYIKMLFKVTTFL